VLKASAFNAGQTPTAPATALVHSVALATLAKPRWAILATAAPAMKIA